jgi:hypothetical protein
MRGPFGLDALWPKAILRRAATECGIPSRPAGEILWRPAGLFFSNALANAYGLRSRGRSAFVPIGTLPAVGPVEHEVGRHSTCIEVLVVPPAAASVMGDTAAATAGHHFPGTPFPTPTACVDSFRVPQRPKPLRTRRATLRWPKSSQRLAGCLPLAPPFRRG